MEPNENMHKKHLGKNILVKEYNEFSITGGTVNSFVVKSLFFDIESYGIFVCETDRDDVERMLALMKRKISNKIRYDLNKVIFQSIGIIDFDFKLGKKPLFAGRKMFFILQLTLFVKNPNTDIKDPALIQHLTKFIEEIIDDILIDNELIYFLRN